MIGDKSEPLWRTIANWSVVLTFFSLPLVVLIVHLTIVIDHIDVKAHAGEFAYLWNFHRILAGLLAAMLGLNSWDKRTNGRKPSDGNTKP